MNHALSVRALSLLGRQGLRHVCQVSTGHSSLCKLKSDVENALQTGKPVVAIESSSFALGLRYPDNKHTAMEIVDIIKDNGAVPAVIGVAEGKVQVGMSEYEIEQLVSGQPFRATARNLAFAVQQRSRATSTVSAALALADLLGIQVVMTSGLGGVHAGGQDSLDISSDLIALGKTAAAVVCSGVSPVYDIPRTLELLDTHEVTTLTLGDTDDFPALMCRQSGAKSSGCLPSLSAAAEVLGIKQQLRARGGLVLAVPAPEHMAIASDVYDAAVAQAEIEASYEDWQGEQLANYLFTRVDEITEHSISRAIRGLLLHNAAVAAQLAVAVGQRHHGDFTPPEHACRHSG